jgi:predicted DNA-binding protein (MmcQ/YjbR family)
MGAGNDLKALPEAEFKSLIQRSHELVLARLPRKLQAALGAQ